MPRQLRASCAWACTFSSALSAHARDHVPPVADGRKFFASDFLVPRKEDGTGHFDSKFGCTEFESARHRSCRRRCRPGLYRGMLDRGALGRTGVGRRLLCRAVSWAAGNTETDARQTSAGPSGTVPAAVVGQTAVSLNDFGPGNNSHGSGNGKITAAAGRGPAQPRSRPSRRPTGRTPPPSHPRDTMPPPFADGAG
jgi:hypothetical protein